MNEEELTEEGLTDPYESELKREKERYERQNQEAYDELTKGNEELRKKQQEETKKGLFDEGSAFRTTAAIGTEVGLNTILDIFSFEPTSQVAGGAFINYLAQKVRGGEISKGEMAAAGLASLIPGGAQGKALTKLAIGTGKGALSGGIEVTGQKVIDEGRLPTAGELGLGLAVGGAFGGIFQTAADSKFIEALGKRIRNPLDDSLTVYAMSPSIPGTGSLPEGGDLSEFLSIKRNRYDIADLMLRKADLSPDNPFYKRLQLSARAVPEFVRRNEDGFLYFDYNLFKDSMRPKQRGRAYIQLFESDLDTILNPQNFAPDAGKGTKTFREFDIAEFRETFLPAAELLGLTGKGTSGRMDVTNVHHIAALKGIMGIFDGLGFNSPMVKQIHKVMKEELGGLGAERANLIRLIGGTADKGSPHQLAHFFLDEAIGTRGEKFFTSDVLVNMGTSDNFRISKARELARIVADSEKIARQAQDAYKRLADAALATDFKDIQDTLERLVTSKKLGYVKLNNVNYAPIIRETAERGGYNVRQFDELIEDIALIHKAVPTGSPKLIDELLFSPQLLKSQKTFQKLVTRIDEKFGDQGVTGAEMRRILDSFDVRMQDAGVGQTGLFEDIPDDLLEDVLNNLQTKKQAKFTKRNQKRYQKDKDIN